MSLLPQTIYRFNAIPIKLPMAFLKIELEQNFFFNFVWRHKRLWIAKIILRKKTGARGIRLLDFRLCYNTIVIKAVWYWHQNRHRPMIQNRKLRNKPIHLWPVSLWQKREDNGEKTVFSISGAGKTGQLHVKEWN